MLKLIHNWSACIVAKIKVLRTIQIQYTVKLVCNMKLVIAQTHSFAPNRTSMWDEG